MVCHIGGQLGTKVVISALGMLALYMCFNGTGIWGGETIVVLSENILDSALWVKLSKWPPFVQGQAIKSYYFQHNRGSFVFWCLSCGFHVCRT